MAATRVCLLTEIVAGSTLLLSGLACAAGETDALGVGKHVDAIVYGEDDRVEPYQAPEPFASLARRAAVALISPQRLNANGDGSYTVDAPLFGEAFSLCAGERFADQPAAANCSGVLVSDDLVATSAHCLAVGADANADCTQSRYVFGYEIPDPDRASRRPSLPVR